MTAVFTAITADDERFIVESIKKHGASTAKIAALAHQFDVAPVYISMIAESMHEEIPVLESVDDRIASPNPKGHTSMKKLTDLSKPEVGSITRIFRAHGTDAARVRRTATQFGITESDARALATACTTSPPAKVVTETAPATTTLDTDASRKATLALRLQQQVNEAEARIEHDGSMAGLSLQELQSLAAAAGAEAGMFGA